MRKACKHAVGTRIPNAGSVASMAAQNRLGSVIPKSASGGTMPCGTARARESGTGRLYGATLLHEEGAGMPAAPARMVGAGAPAHAAGGGSCGRESSPSMRMADEMRTRIAAGQPADEGAPANREPAAACANAPKATRDLRHESLDLPACGGRLAARVPA